VVTTFAPNMIEFNKTAASETVTRLGEHYADLSLDNKTSNEQ